MGCVREWRNCVSREPLAKDVGGASAFPATFLPGKGLGVRGEQWIRCTTGSRDSAPTPEVHHCLASGAHSPSDSFVFLDCVTVLQSDLSYS